MSTQIRKSPEIQGEVLFLDGNGQECPVQDQFSEYEILEPYEQMLTFFGYERQFVPVGKENAFKEGYQYTLLFLEGNELIIMAEPGPPPQWISV